MKHAIVFTLATILLAACATEPSPNTLPTLAPTNEAPPTQEVIDTINDNPDDLNLGGAGGGLFTAEVTGATTTTVAGSGSYRCESGTNVLGSASGANEATFSLPSDIATGEFTIGTGDNAITSTLVLGDVSYTDDIFGIITLNAVPSAPGEPVSGSFDMNYTNDGNAVNVSGTFDLLAESVCPS
ncbi:MAG: hypothetical protein AAF125_16035 [Chloroflexota bacterium]